MGRGLQVKKYSGSVILFSGEIKTAKRGKIQKQTIHTPLTNA